MLAFFGTTPDLLIVCAIVLLLFGNRLPQVMRGMGQGISEFKRGLKDIENDVKGELTSDERKKEIPSDVKKEVPSDAK